MATPDLLPPTDPEFDTLQEILVAAVVANAVAWGIPAGEVTDVTTAQTPWTTTWAIAKNKQNATTTQREAKDLARKDYEEVLRPFIQKWIYRNAAMDSSDIELCGLRPRDNTRTPAVRPDKPVAVVKRGNDLELLAECNLLENADLYGCILVEGTPIGAKITFTEFGKFIFNTASGSILGLQIDLSKKRKKKFTGLKHDATYYLYFFAINSAGASPLSDPVSIVCW